MTGVVVAVLLLGFVLWRVRRARRAVMLAGITSERPTFMIEPPRRRVGNRRTELL